MLAEFQLLTISHKVVDFVHKRSDGVPFVLKYTFSSLLDARLFVIDTNGNLTLDGTKVADAKQLEELEMPDTVRDLMRTRLAKLNADSLDILFVAATMGRFFSLKILEMAMEHKTKRVGEAQEARSRVRNVSAVLTRLVKSGLLSVDTHGDIYSDKTIKFTSLASVETLYDMQSSPNAMDSHLAIATALEERLRQQGVVVNPGSARTQRRGSIGPAPNIQQRSLAGALPKMALHFERAGKRLRALELYFQAGRVLSRNGIDGSAEMFLKCDELASDLGDDVSQYMRATYLFHYSTAIASEGNTTDGLRAAVRSIEFLGESVVPSTFNLAFEFLTLYLSDSCLCCFFGGGSRDGGGGATVVGADVVEILKMKTYVSYEGIASDK